MTEERMIKTMELKEVMEKAIICNDSYFEIYNIYEVYHFIYLLFEKEIAGFIMDYGIHDFYVYIIPELRGKKILSNFIRNGLFKKCLPNLKECTCLKEHDLNEVNKIHHIADLIGIKCITEYTPKIFHID